MGYLEVFNWEQRSLFKLSGNECRALSVGCVDVINSLPTLHKQPAKASCEAVRAASAPIATRGVLGKEPLFIRGEECLLLFTDSRYAAISWIDDLMD
jgi:hypothetical protein